MDAQKLEAINIKNFFMERNQNIKLAVILSCHSESIGSIFLNCGIQHVICIKRLHTIDDDACLIFTNALYTALFDGVNPTVCGAYHHAIDILKNSNKNNKFKEEAEKFLLLKKKGTEPEHSTEC